MDLKILLLFEEEQINRRILLNLIFKECIAELTLYHE